jgi:hypothetical protein
MQECTIPCALFPIWNCKSSGLAFGISISLVSYGGFAAFYFFWWITENIANAMNVRFCELSSARVTKVWSAPNLVALLQEQNLGSWKPESLLQTERISTFIFLGS